MKKIGKTLVLITLCFSGFCMYQVPAQADTGKTGLTVTFAENSDLPTPTPPKGSTDAPTGEDIVHKKGGMVGSSLSSKRLPSTNDQYNQTLSLLGYMILAVWLFFLVIGKRKERKEDEAST